MQSPLARIVSWWVLAIAVALAGSTPTPAVAGAPGLIVEDVNNDGVYDALDHDVTATVLADGSFSTPHSILVARALTSRHPFGIVLVAGKNIRVNADLNAVAPGAGLTLVAQEGVVVLGGRVDVMAKGYIDVSSAAGIEVGPLASLQSRDAHGGLFLTTDGNIVGAEGSRFLAKGGMDIVALSGEVHVGPGPVITTSSYLSITSGGPAWISSGRLQTPSLSMVTFEAPITFSGNMVKFSQGGFALFSGATVDLTETTFSGLDPDNLIIDADSVPE